MSLAAFAYFGLMYLVVSSLEYYLAAKYVCHPSERYFHWRSMLLKFATWPIYFYAFVLMLFDKKIPYIPTSKQVGAGKSVMAKPHLFYSLLVGLSLAGVFVRITSYNVCYTKLLRIPHRACVLPDFHLCEKHDSYEKHMLKTCQKMQVTVWLWNNE